MFFHATRPGRASRNPFEVLLHLHPASVASLGLTATKRPPPNEEVPDLAPRLLEDMGLSGETEVTDWRLLEMATRLAGRWA